MSTCPCPFRAPPYSHQKEKKSGCFSLSIALCFNKQFAVTLCVGIEFELDCEEVRGGGGTRQTQAFTRHEARLTTWLLLVFALECSVKEVKLCKTTPGQFNQQHIQGKVNVLFCFHFHWNTRPWPTRSKARQAWLPLIPSASIATCGHRSTGQVSLPPPFLVRRQH